MAQNSLDMGFLSSLVNVSFPNIIGLIWIQMGVNQTGPLISMALQGGPLTLPFTMINGINSAGPLGSPSTPLAYGGSRILYPETPPNSEVAANFFVFRVAGKSAINIKATITGGKPFCSLACALVKSLDYSTIKLNSYGFDTGEVSFSDGAGTSGGLEYLESGGLVTYFGKNVKAFGQNNSAGVSNTFTFTITSCSVTQN